MRGSPGCNDVFYSAFDNAPTAMALLDPRGVILLCNPAVGTLLERDTTELVGDTFFTFTHLDDLPDAERNCRSMQHGTARIVRHECRFLRADGSPVWVSVSTSRAPGSASEPPHLIMHIEDIDARKALEAKLRHQASHDPLTGLANRTLLLSRVADAAGLASCLFFLDLDGFKSVNDRFGHRTGDHVLRELADRMRALLGDGGTAARLGGDEFAVLGVDITPTDAARVADQLRAMAADPFHIEGRVLQLSAAVGLTFSPPAAEVDPEALLAQADRRMYRAKADSRSARAQPQAAGPAR